MLDIGCGELWPLRTLISTFWTKKSSVLRSYVGVDIEEQPLDFIGPKLAREIEVRFLRQDLTQQQTFPLGEESVDLALSLESIEHMPKQFVPLWLKDLARCMQPGALGFFSTPNRDYARDQPKYHGDYEWGFAELRELLEQHFRIENIVGTFIRRATFNRANREHRRIPDELVSLLTQRFGPAALRNVLAVPYPEYAENVCWLMRK